MTNWFTKPKGLAIHSVSTPGRDLDGRPARKLAARFKTRGRTGAATRERFSRCPDFRRQRILADWLMGRASEIYE